MNRNIQPSLPEISLNCFNCGNALSKEIMTETLNPQQYEDDNDNIEHVAILSSN